MTIGRPVCARASARISSASAPRPRNANGEVRVAELPDHPFCVASLFQPELSSDPTWVHPLIVAFAAAVRHHVGDELSPTPPTPDTLVASTLAAGVAEVA